MSSKSKRLGKARNASRVSEPSSPAMGKMQRARGSGGFTMGAAEPRRSRKAKRKGRS